MNLYRVEEAWGVVVTLTVGLVIAAVCGVLAGSGDFLWLFVTISVLAAIATFAVLRFRIFLLIPIFWGLSFGNLSSSVPLGIKDIAILLAGAGFIVCVSLKIIRVKPAWETIDLWILVVLAYMVLTFFRNPVGVHALGSERVGGKGYFNAFEAALVYYMLSRVSCSPGEARWLPIFMILGNCLAPALGLLTYAFPGFGPLVERLYAADPMTGTVTAFENQDPTVPRLFFLAPAGQGFVQGLVSYFDPRTVINPIFFGRFFLLIAGLAMIFLSGFRTVFVVTFLIFMVSSYARHGLFAVVRIAIAAAVVFGIVMLAQGTLINLPPAVQRTLSFLPGRWDPDVLEDAEGSSQWRFEMWQTALSTDRYMHNKILGDGFGFTQEELALAQIPLEYQSREETQENYMVTGGFHSGLMTMLRVVGCVGGVLFYGLIITLAIESWKLIRRTTGTPFFPLTLYICIPLVLLPFTYTFVGGNFDTDLSGSLFAAGMVKLISRSLENHRLTLKPQAPENEATPREAALPKYVIAHR